MDKTFQVMKYGIFSVLALTTMNLILSVLIYRNLSQEENREIQVLPDKINLEKDNIAGNMIKYWNERNLEQLYGELGDIAKGEVSNEVFKKQTADLLSLGKISNPVYVNFRYEGKYKGYDAYDLIYAINVDNKKGRLTISVIDLGSHYEILGFNLSRDYTS